MANKFRGPLVEDYKRALKAAKWAGVKAVRIEIGEGAIVLIMDDAYLEKLALGLTPAQELKGKLPGPNW